MRHDRPCRPRRCRLASRDESRCNGGIRTSDQAGPDRPAEDPSPWDRRYRQRRGTLRKPVRPSHRRRRGCGQPGCRWRERRWPARRQRECGQRECGQREPRSGILGRRAVAWQYRGLGSGPASAGAGLDFAVAERTSRPGHGSRGAGKLANGAFVMGGNRKQPGAGPATPAHGVRRS